jgi:hypothetical protein
MTAVRCSEHTAVTLSLGTGEECKVTNPPNLSHLSNEHLGGLLSSVHAEWKSRNLSDLHEAFQQEEVPEGSLLNIGLEQ